MARDQATNRTQSTNRQPITVPRRIVSSTRTWDNWSGTLWNTLNAGSTTWNQMGASGSRQQVA